MYVMDPMLFEAENAHGQQLFPARVTYMDPKLFEAVTSGDINDLELLVRGGIDVLRQVTPMKDTSIHIAARHGHLGIITNIHARCPELLTKANSIGDTPLHMAARSGHLRTVSCLIDCAESTDVEAGRREELHRFIRKANIEKNTVMHEAVRYGDLQMVDYLAEKDPELLCLDNYVGESPLHMAVEKGEFEIVKRIVVKDRYSHNGPHGRTALHAAVIHRKSAIIKLLLEKKLELIMEVDDNMRTALHFASTLGFIELVHILLKFGTSTSYMLDKSGSAPIHLSARFGRIDVMKEVLRRRPDLKDLIDGKCQNVLHIAVGCMQTKVVKYILGEKTLGGLINGRDKDGNTPLHQAAFNSYPYIVNLLVRDKRVDTAILNRKRLTALDIARSQRQESVEDSKELVLATLLYFTVSPYPRSVWIETLRCHVNLRRVSTEWYKDKGNTLLVVATLVATVTFAAGFTVPGGYQSDGTRQGTATLAGHAKFEQFIWWDSLAMYFSMVAVILLVRVQFVRHLQPAFLLLHSSQILSILALQCMSLAFISGLNLTLVENKSLNRNISTLGYTFSVVVCARLIQYLKPILYFCPCYIHLRAWASHLSENFFRTFNANGLTTNEKNEFSLLHYT